MKNSNFYDDLEFKYPEIAIVLENPTNSTVKIIIPAITPFIEQDEPYDKIDTGVSKINILNKDKSNLDIKECTLSNYIEVDIPEFIDYDTLRKGDKLVVSFIGGDINKPYILGRYK